MLTAPPARSEAMGRAPSDAERVGPPDDVETVYVGFVTRTIAIAIDALWICAVALAVAGAALLIFAVFAVTKKHHDLALVIGALAFVIWVVGYFLAFWTTTGQTPGNRLMQIRVARYDGSRVRPRHALIRLGAMVLSLPLFWGYLPILMSTRRRGLPDRLAGTVVVFAERGSADST